MSRLLLDHAVDGILAGAGDPRADERGALGELTALVVAAAARRPERLVVLAGTMAAAVGDFGDLQARVGETLLAPAARFGEAGAPLRDLLTELALPVDDARRAMGEATKTLADVLDRRIEVVETGYDGGLRAFATPRRPRRNQDPSTWPSSRPRVSPRPIRRCGRGPGPGVVDGRLGSGIDCATGCASCGLRPGPMRLAMGSCCVPRPPGPHSAACSRPRRMTPNARPPT